MIYEYSINKAEKIVNDESASIQAIRVAELILTLRDNGVIKITYIFYNGNTIVTLYNSKGIIATGSGVHFIIAIIAAAQCMCISFPDWPNG